jgi:hypothetical protein
MKKALDAAFPQQAAGIGNGIKGGLSVRDYMAAAALQGVLASYAGTEPATEPGPDVMALAAYRLADAMLKARGA